MTDASFPPSLKAIKPYLIRAKELEVARPLVSYYANVYALQLGIRERDASDQLAANFTTALLQKCQKLRPQFAADVDSHKEQLEEFAFSVYEGAEQEYMAGAATKVTSQRFYAAMCFFDICTHFGELPEDLAGMRQKSREYAVKISRDIKEGKKPLPPKMPEFASEEQEEIELADELKKSGISSAGIPPAPPREDFEAPGTELPTDRFDSPAPQQPYPSNGSEYSGPDSFAAEAPPTQYASAPPVGPVTPPPSGPALANVPAPVSAPVTAPVSAPVSAPVPAVPLPVAGYTPDMKALGEAQKRAKYAVSALDFQDSKTAIKELLTALSLLQGSAPP